MIEIMPCSSPRPTEEGSDVAIGAEEYAKKLESSADTLDVTFTDKPSHGGEKTFEFLQVRCLFDAGGLEDAGRTRESRTNDSSPESQGLLLLDNLLTLLIKSLTWVFKLSCLFPTVVIVLVAPPRSFCTEHKAASIVEVFDTN